MAHVQKYNSEKGPSACNKRIVALLFALMVSVVATASLCAYPRISVGGSFAGLAMQGTLAGPEYGTLESRTLAPMVTVEGEVIPVDQWSLFMRFQLDPFKPEIKSGNVVQPADPKAAVPYSIAGRAALGTGWQLPFSDWTRTDVPFDLTLGIGAEMDFMHLSYSTPAKNYSSFEAAFGAGLYVAASVYFGPSFGLSLSTMPSVTLMDYTSVTDTATGGDAVQTGSLTFTSLKFSWDAMLAATIRFGW